MGFLAFAISFIITAVLVPPTKSLALKLGLIDKVNLRKQHKKPLVRVGGIAMFLGALITLGSLFLLLPEDQFFLIDNSLSLKLFGVVFVYFLIGLIDDLYDLSPWPRLGLQICTTCFIWFQNIRIGMIAIPFSPDPDPIILNDTLSLFITILWVVGITNAINWIDGLDGLAAGVVGIASSGFIVASIYYDNQFTLLLSSLLTGTCFAFLIYNFFPAKIIMGDSGSNFLGFLISLISILIYSPIDKIANNQLYLITTNPSLLILAVPILDMIVVIISRIYNKSLPFFPDRRHFHHKLLNAGVNHKDAVLIIYSICVLLCFISLITL